MVESGSYAPTIEKVQEKVVDVINESLEANNLALKEPSANFMRQTMKTLGLAETSAAISTAARD
jgi:hypothetical protein